jgi:two-component system C4-dicarboxylate transport sensor histidine kinase DctB
LSARPAQRSDANKRLRQASPRRIGADRRWPAASEELTQANRLGLIGQVTAGVAHEINQPMAAIRAFAENAGRYLDRQQPERARDSLGSIVDMTDRIARITTELRSFAQRRTPLVQEAALGEAIDGALLLIGDRIRAAGVRLDRSPLAEDPKVIADKMRLEQILINLMQNALDALKDTPNPCIAITVDAGNSIVVTIADNGPGLSPEIAGSLFTPFVTSKADGLGLGLGIARDIAREFGGSLTVAETPLGGAAFRICLRRA